GSRDSARTAEAAEPRQFTDTCRVASLLADRRDARAVMLPWSLECSGCGATRNAAGLPGVCGCGQPYLVRYRSTPAPEAKALLPGRRRPMSRSRASLPLPPPAAPLPPGDPP